MANKAYDSYGYSLQEFLNKAIAEGRTDYAEVFNDALIKAAEGDPTLASHICKTIANYYLKRHGKRIENALNLWR